MLHWIFKSWQVQQFVTGCMEGFYDKAVHDADKAVLSAYMERGDASGLTWDLEERLSEIEEAVRATTGGANVLRVLWLTIQKELRWRDVDEAARPLSIDDARDAIEDVRARWDGEVCEAGQAVLDTVQDLQQAMHHWIDNVSTEEHGSAYQETKMSIALTSAMAVMVMAVDHGKAAYWWGLSNKYRLKDFQVEAVTEAACELAEWRLEDMRRWPQIGWTEDEISRLKWKMLEGIKPVSSGWSRSLFHICDERSTRNCESTTCHEYRFPPYSDVTS